MAIGKTEAYEAVVKYGVERRGECLLYKGSIGNRGYGKVHFKNRYLSIHRVSYERWHGFIPAGLHVDHKCHNDASHRGECAGGPTCHHKRCINPAHLRVVTCKENLNAVAKRHGPRKTQCPQGHEYTPENTTIYINRRGTMQRNCRLCEKARTKRRVEAGEFRGR